MQLGRVRGGTDARVRACSGEEDNHEYSLNKRNLQAAILDTAGDDGLAARVAYQNLNSLVSANPPLTRVVVPIRLCALDTNAKWSRAGVANAPSIRTWPPLCTAHKCDSAGTDVYTV